MNIFIIAKTQAGKTTLSNNLLELTSNSRIIKMSEYFRTHFVKKESDFLTNKEYVQAMTDFSVAILKDNKNFNIEYIASKYNLEDFDINIFEGIRNINDFIYFFNPNEDKVIIIETISNNALTVFDEGVDIIKGYVDWLKKCNILDNYLLTILRDSRNKNAFFEIYKEIEEYLKITNLKEKSY